MASTDMDKKNVPEPVHKKARVRSPAFPFISLAKAIERAQAFWNSEKRNAAPVAAAAHDWDFKSPKSSSALQTFAAVKYFGLFEDVGTGNARKVRLTDLALRIVLDQREGSEEQLKAIQEAALKPKIHQELWVKWGAELPSDATFRHHLVVDRKFNEDSAAAFMAEYKSTIAFAKLTESGTLSGDEADSANDQDDILVGFEMKTDPAKKDPVIPPVNLPAGTQHQDELQYRLSKDGVVLVYRGRVTKKVMQKLISYLTIDLETMPEPGTAGT